MAGAETARAELDEPADPRADPCFCNEPNLVSKAAGVGPSLVSSRGSNGFRASERMSLSSIGSFDFLAIFAETERVDAAVAATFRTSSWRKERARGVDKLLVEPLLRSASESRRLVGLVQPPPNFAGLDSE